MKTAPAPMAYAIHVLKMHLKIKKTDLKSLINISKQVEARSDNATVKTCKQQIEDLKRALAMIEE